MLDPFSIAVGVILFGSGIAIGGVLIVGYVLRGFFNVMDRK